MVLKMESKILSFLPCVGCIKQKWLNLQDELNMEAISYPVAVKDIPKFEKQNDISINIFGYEDGYYPLYISRDQNERHINLLLLEEKGENTLFLD